MNKHLGAWWRRTAIGAGIAIPLLTAMIWIRLENRTPPTARIETAAGPILVEIAVTAASRSAGLSNRRDLRGVDGLLLKWDTPGRHPIWMADMRFPLDLAWIDASGRVLALLANVPPCPGQPCQLYEPQGTDRAVAVLELRAGAAANHGIAVGATLKY